MSFNLTNEQKETIVAEALRFEKEIASKYGISSDAIQQCKREYFLRNNSFSFEFEKLQSTMLNLQILKPLLHAKIYHTGMLFQALILELKDKFDGYKLTEEYVLASYYANFGFLSLEDCIFKSQYVTPNDMRIIQRHIHIGADLLNEKGMPGVARIVKLHHEKPNGTGYLKEQNHDDKTLAILNISDEFIDVTVPSKSPEARFVPEEAIDHSLKGYETHLLIPREEIEIIKQVLDQYFRKNLRLQ